MAEYRNNDDLIRLAKENICLGVLMEPRWYYDSFTIPTASTAIVAGNPDVFQNGEQFPVVITHLTMAIRGVLNDVNATPDERLIQRIGLRIAYHDQWYMNRDFPVVPLWGNRITAAADSWTQGSAVWRFDRPVILGTRDSIQVQAIPEQVPVNSRTARVSFTGVGLQSRRPYFLQGELAFTAAALGSFNTQDFRNDGTEPIALDQVVVNYSAEANASNPNGDIRLLRLNFRHIGGGTSADWGQGPIGAASLPQGPAVLLGQQSGRCLVHKIPGDGWIWEPGEGVTVDIQPRVAITNGCRFTLGMLGYIAVT